MVEENNYIFSKTSGKGPWARSVSISIDLSFFLSFYISILYIYIYIYIYLLCLILLAGKIKTSFFSQSYVCFLFFGGENFNLIIDGVAIKNISNKS